MFTGSALLALPVAAAAAEDQADGVFDVEAFQSGLGDRAAAQAAIDAAVAAAEASAGAAVVRFRPDKVYAFEDGGALKLPPGFNGQGLRITGGGCRVVLSKGCPRMFDFDRQADYDTFQRFEIEDFVVDAADVGGYGHVLIGTTPGGVQQMRINVRDLAVRRIRLLNVTTSVNGTSRKCIWIVGAHDAPGETRTVLRDLVFEDLYLDGGRTGILVAGEFSRAGREAGYRDGLEVYHDGIEIRRCEHTLRAPAPVGLLSANFQIAGSGYGDRVLISDCKGWYSSDVGVEVDAMQHAVIERTEIIDPWRIGFTQNNIATPRTPETQTFTVRDCVTRRQALSRVKGFGCGGAQNVAPPAALLFDGCVFHSTCAEPPGVGHPMFSFLAAPRSVTIRDCSSLVEGYDKLSTGTAAQVDGICFTPVKDGTTKMVIRGLRLVNTGRRSAGTLAWRGILQQGGTLQFDVDGLEADVAIDGVQRRGLRVVELAKGTAFGTIKGLRVVRAEGDPSAVGVQFAPQPELTVDTSLRVIFSDFGGMPSTGTDVAFLDPSNKPAVFFTGNRWCVFPRPAKTLVVQSSPFTFRNLEGYPIVLNVASGDTAAIELSRDGSTWADTGVRAGQLQVECTDHVRITYGSAAPSVSFLPAV